MHYQTYNKQTYDALATQYEEKVAKRKDYNKQVISRFVKHITTGKDILDIGCAVGLDISLFIEMGFSATGIDISEEMVRLARKRNPEAKILVGDFTNISLDKQFDAIFAQSFIHLYPKLDVVAVLQKIKQLLKKNGVAHITTSKSNKSDEGWKVKSDYSGNHKRFRKHWTQEELTQTLSEAGFDIVEYYVTTDPFNKEWMVFAIKNND